jgi:hypothetical protein
MALYVDVFGQPADEEQEGENDRNHHHNNHDATHTLQTLDGRW